MPWSEDELVSGCPPPDDYEGNLAPGEVSRIVDGIEAEVRRTGGAPSSSRPEPGPRRNPHLTGDGYGEGR